MQPDGSIPPSQVLITPVDSFFTGDDPAAVTFDLSGSGLMLVTNAGDNSISFINYSGDSPKENLQGNSKTFLDFNQAEILFFFWNPGHIRRKRLHWYLPLD